MRRIRREGKRLLPRLTVGQVTALGVDTCGHINVLTLDECYERYLIFLRKWHKTNPAIDRLFARYENRMFYYYDFPHEYNYRLLTVNLTKGFFSHLRTLLQKYPGWTSPEQVYLIMGIFLKSMKTYREMFNSQQMSIKNGAFIYAY